MTRFSFFFLLASLLCAALATNVPAVVYRADQRNPDKIKEAGGFKSFGKNEDISVIEHVSKQYDTTKKNHRGGQDPWISTSSSATIGEEKTVTKPCWIYTIETSGISSKFTDVAKAYADAKDTYTHTVEAEWAAKLEIPLSHIKEFYYLKKDLTKGKVYTWATWAAKKTKTTRDDIPEAEEAGTSRAVEFRA